MLQWVCIEAQGLVEVNLSAILDLFGFSQFVSCPQAMSFFPLETGMLKTIRGSITTESEHTQAF